MVEEFRNFLVSGSDLMEDMTSGFATAYEIHPKKIKDIIGRSKIFEGKITNY